MINIRLTVDDLRAIPIGCSIEKTKVVVKSKGKFRLVAEWKLKKQEGVSSYVLYGRNIKWLIFQMKIHLLREEFAKKGVFDRDRWYYRTKIQ